MTITIKNANKDFLKAVKEVAKLASLKVQAAQTDEDIAKQWQQEADEALQLYKEGKLEAYDSAKEMHKAILK